MSLARRSILGSTLPSLVYTRTSWTSDSDSTGSVRRTTHTPPLVSITWVCCLDHWQYFADGLEKSIVYRAVTTLNTERWNRQRVTWLFNQLALGDKHKFLKFVASIPRHKIPDLVPPTIESVFFREYLLILLRSCSRQTCSFGSTDEDVQRRSLLVV